MAFQTPYKKKQLVGRRAANRVNYREDTIEDIQNDNYSIIKKKKIQSIASSSDISFDDKNASVEIKRTSILEEESQIVICKPKKIKCDDNLYKPFKIPFKDPKKIEQYKNFNYDAIALGYRQSYNPAALLRPLHDPDEDDALILYKPSKTISENEKVKLISKMMAAYYKKETIELPEIAVVVDPRLATVLRPHQIEGVRFLYDCVTGKKITDNYGCIMADEMGLGKTLQCITLLWTLIKQSPTPGKPLAQRCVIACPSSLVKNWANEFIKWLGPGMVNPIVCDHKANVQFGSAKEQLDADLVRFQRSTGYRTSQVLIISYETLRANAAKLGKTEIGLMLCDEGHRLKNSNNQTFQALNQLNVKRRVILSGTPIQNDLSEYFSLLNFANPNLLGTTTEFRKNFEHPISKARDSFATDKEKEIGDQKLKELNSIVSRVIIRRTNDLLSKYLPTKYEHVVFCKLSPKQEELYQMFIKSKQVKNLLNQEKAKSLNAINILKKLVNHPSLLSLPEDIQGSESIVPELIQKHDRTNIRSFNKKGNNNMVYTHLSSKLDLLDKMLKLIRESTNDRVVLISNYTQTLDLFEKLAVFRGYSFTRLDGTMSTNKRQKIVDKFNNPEEGQFLFLLSSKAGGCGINLIGANRLFLFDPDWNPASDQQALARVWRDGQIKTCYIYRLIAVGTIEEKIFQRQSHKQALSNCVVDENQLERHFSVNDLKELFKLNNDDCQTHDTFNCKFGCDNPERPNAVVSDISTWSHISINNKNFIKDRILKLVAKDFKQLTYVFQFKSHEAFKKEEQEKVQEIEDDEEIQES